MTILKDKIAIITGAASGIGLATARLFAQHGASLMLVDLNTQGLAQVYPSFDASRTRWQQANVAVEADNEAYVQATIDAFGGLDIAVLNAGLFGGFDTIGSGDTDAFDRIMDVNVRGLWLGLKYVIPPMQKRKTGSIVITGSTAAFRAGAPGRSGYVASKHAAIGLMRSAAAECGPFNVRVNSVNPGGVETPMVERLRASMPADQAEAVTQQFIDSTLLNRLAEPGEIAQMNLFLASDLSSYCTAGNFMVDGGLLG